MKKASEAGLIASGECTNCGQCIPVCPEDTLAFNLRPLIQRHQNPENQRKMP
ncbi:MAG: 4Fe-4S binding protein [Pseudomonadota bacterium]